MACCTGHCKIYWWLTQHSAIYLIRSFGVVISYFVAFVSFGLLDPVPEEGAGIVGTKRRRGSFCIASLLLRITAAIMVPALRVPVGEVAHRRRRRPSHLRCHRHNRWRRHNLARQQYRYRHCIRGCRRRLLFNGARSCSLVLLRPRRS